MPASRIRPFEMSASGVSLLRDGRSEVTRAHAGPERGVDGFMVAAPVLTRNPPHGGEMHPDGDEFIYLLSGRFDLIAGEDGAETVTPMAPGQAVIIPKGVWHRLEIREPCHIVVMTPGPGGEHRPPDNQTRS